jgi:hypothetical protein
MTTILDVTDLALVEVNAFSTELERYFAAEIRRLRAIVAEGAPTRREVEDLEAANNLLEIDNVALADEVEDLKDKIVRLEDDIYELRKAIES